MSARAVTSTGRGHRRRDLMAGARPVPGCPEQTFPTSTRSLDMLLLHEELARAQISERHAEMAQTVRLARLAAAKRRQRRTASARRRMRLALAVR